MLRGRKRMRVAPAWGAAPFIDGFMEAGDVIYLSSTTLHSGGGNEPEGGSFELHCEHKEREPQGAAHVGQLTECQRKCWET